MMSPKNKNILGGKLTKEFLWKLCSKQDGMYSVPHLNDILYLHYQGITEIENLEEYTNVKCLYLQNNLIKKIENLNSMKNLKLLFLNNNAIEKIENLEDLLELDKIDLSNNLIQNVENLSGLKSLTSLDLSHNKLQSASDIAHLTQCSGLTMLRLSHNHLSEPSIIEVLGRLKKLRALFLDGNPLVNQVSNYRKKMIIQLPELHYLDKNPVKSEERSLAKAWKTGGDDAMDLLRLEWKTKNDLEFKEKHLKLYERLKQKYPEFFPDVTEIEDDNHSEPEDLIDQVSMSQDLKLPWHSTQDIKHSNRPCLVQELNECESYGIETLEIATKVTEDSNSSTCSGFSLAIQEINDKHRNETTTQSCESLEPEVHYEQSAEQDSIKETLQETTTTGKNEVLPLNSQDFAKTRQIPEELLFSLEQRLMSTTNNDFSGYLQNLDE